MSIFTSDRAAVNKQTAPFFYLPPECQERRIRRMARNGLLPEQIASIAGRSVREIVAVLDAAAGAT